MILENDCNRFTQIAIYSTRMESSKRKYKGQLMLPDDAKYPRY